MNAFLETRTYGSDFPVSAFHATDNNFLAHWHIEVEMVFVCEGSIRIGINKESRVLSQGELAICGSTDIHYYDSRESHSKIIVLVFRPELVGSPGGWPGNMRFDPAFIDNGLFNHSPETLHQIREIFYSIANEMQLKKPFYDLYVSGRLSELCALALRHFPTCAAGVNEKGGKLPDIQKIQYAIQYLEENYMHDISLDDISKKSNLSPYYFSRLFGKFTGLTFKDYLSRIRVAKAEQSIRTGAKSIIDISFECGFNSIRTFNRTFKAVKGYPPSKIGQGMR